MWTVRLISTTTLSTIPDFITAVFLSLTSLLSNILSLIPQVCSGKYDIRDLPSDLIEEVVTYLMNDSSDTHLDVADSNSNTSLRDEISSASTIRDERAFGTIDMTEFRTSHSHLHSHRDYAPNYPPFRSTIIKPLITRLTSHLALMYYRYEVTMGIYVLTYTEKVILNSFVLGMSTALVYAVYLLIPASLFSLVMGVVRAVPDILRMGRSGCETCALEGVRNFTESMGGQADIGRGAGWIFDQ